MNAEQKDFSIASVLSVTTGVLLCDMSEIYDILNFMTGGSLFTHQLPGASEDCAPKIFEQHPELRAVCAEGVGRDNWESFLVQQQERFGDYVSIARLSGYEQRDPFEELAEMVDPEKIIVVTA